MRALRLAVAVWAGVMSTILVSCGGAGGGSPGSGNPSLVTLLTTSLPNGTTGVFYNATFQADFPHTPGAFIVVGGTLPTGVRLDKRTGVLYGYARQVGSFSFSVAARDGVDPTIPQNRDSTFAEDRRNFTVTIALGPPNLLPQAIPAGQFNSSYGYQLDVAGGTAPYTFALTGGTLPSGITLSSSGFLGNYAGQGRALPFNFTVTLTDATGLTDTEDFSLQVVTLPLIILTSDPIPLASQDFPYSLQLQLASIGGGSPITWSQKPVVAGETLLSAIGLEITSAGLIRNMAGTLGPTTPGTFAFTISVTDFATQVTTRQYHLTVISGPVLASISPKRATIPGPYIATGLNFLPGAKLIFKPGPNQVVTTPTFVSATTLRLNTTPAMPGGGGGLVAVQVLNTDGGFHTKPGAFIFPANNIVFSATAAFPVPQSALSSTGLDAGDVNRDGFCDFVHCGSNSFWVNASGSTSGVDLMLNKPTAGVFSATNPPFTRVRLSTTDDWYSVKLADVDTDGDLDVVALGNVGGVNVVRTWINPYPAAFTATAAFADTDLNWQGNYTNKVNDMAMGPITGPDVLPDFAYVTAEGFHSSFNSSSFATTYMGGSVATMRGNGSGTFSGLDLRNNLNFAVGGGVAVGQFDGDTQADVVASDGAGGEPDVWNQQTGRFPQAILGQSGVFLPSSSGSGFFGTDVPLTRASAAGAVEHLGASSGDINGDGREDIVLPANTQHTYYGGNPTGGTPGLYPYFGSSSGTFTEAPVSDPSVVPEWRYSVVFDADFDTPFDIAVTAGPGRIDFFHGRTGLAGPVWKQTVDISAGSPNIGRIAAGDFDGDGRTDVCVAASFLADFNDPQFGIIDQPQNRGLGGTQGVFILLNQSN